MKWLKRVWASQAEPGPAGCRLGEPQLARDGRGGRDRADDPVHQRDPAAVPRVDRRERGQAGRPQRPRPERRRPAQGVDQPVERRAPRAPGGDRRAADRGGRPAQRDGRAGQGEGGQRQVFNLDVTWTAEFAQSGYLRPLSGVDTGGFLRRPLESCRYQGKLWALPFNTDAGLLFYRKDLVKEEPLGLDEIATTSTRTLRASQDARLAGGFAGQFADYEGLTVNALELIWAEKGDVVDETGKVVIDSERTRRALRWLADGLKGDKPVVLPDSRAQNEPLSTQSFRDGKVVFMRNWPVAHRVLQGNRQESAGRPGIDFTVAQLPGPSVLGGQNLAISAKSAKPRAAQALIEFLTGPRSQQLLFERGGLAATRGIVYQDSRIASEHPYASTLLKAIENARLRPVTPYYSRFSDEFRSIVRYAIDHDGSLPANAEESLTGALQGH